MKLPKVLTTALDDGSKNGDPRIRGDLYACMPRYLEGQRRRRLRAALKGNRAITVSKCRWKRLVRLHGTAKARAIVLGEAKP